MVHQFTAKVWTQPDQISETVIGFSKKIFLHDLHFDVISCFVQKDT